MANQPNWSSKAWDGEALGNQAGWQSAQENMSPTGTRLSAVPSLSHPIWISAIRKGCVEGRRQTRNVTARLELG